MRTRHSDCPPDEVFGYDRNHLDSRPLPPTPAPRWDFIRVLPAIALALCIWLCVAVYMGWVEVVR